MRAVLSAMIVLGLMLGFSGKLGWRAGAVETQDVSTERAARQLVADRCSVCHSTDLVTQQRLNPARWKKTVEKMIRWGAVLSPAERDILMDFLAGQYHPDEPLGENAK